MLLQCRASPGLKVRCPTSPNKLLLVLKWRALRKPRHKPRQQVRASKGYRKHLCETAAHHKCPKKHAHFEELDHTYLQARLQALENEKDEPVGAGCKRRTLSQTQEDHTQTMRSNMQEFARVGVVGPERTWLDAADWKARIRPQLKGDGAKAKSEGVMPRPSPRAA